MTPIIEIIRRNQDINQTLGTCCVMLDNDLPVFSSLSLERGWRNNEKNVSCIPIGIYTVELEFSPKFNTNLWEIKGVPNRTETKFHWASFYYNLEGCVSLGIRPKNLNNDNYLDLTNSKNTILDFNKSLTDFKKALLIIKAGKVGIF